MDFVCKDPDALVRAANVRATLEAFNLQPALGKQLIEKHKLKVDDLREDNFVPVQRWLDALKEIEQTVGPLQVRAVGSKIVENALFPPTFKDVGSVLQALDTIYYLNHKGQVGHYKTTIGDDASIRVQCETPYPRSFERGLVEGICRNQKLAQGRKFFIRYEDGPPGSDVTCVVTAVPLKV